MRHEIDSLAGLGALGGGMVDALFRRELAAAIKDLLARPGAGSARRITLKVILTPVADDEGCLSAIGTEVEVESRLPIGRTRSFSMGQKGEQALVYNDLAPDNHNQGTIDEELERARKQKGKKDEQNGS